MLGGYYVSVLIPFAQEAGFHFVLEEMSRFHISDGVWDIIPDLSSDVGKLLFESSNRGFGIWKSCILRVSYFEI